MLHLVISLIFFNYNPDGLFVISLASLFQTSRMCMVLLAKVVFCFVGRGMA